MIGQETDDKYLSYHFDYRGSTVALTDSSGQVTESFQYSPYGLLLSGDASKTPFLFNGMYGVMTDANNLYYMRARFYNPEIKRFINQDILLGDISEGQTLNRYAFVTGQPVSFVDPEGKLPIPAIIIIIWGGTELGLTAYDVYNTIQTLLDPEASYAEKGITACGLLLGAIAPGGGYSSAIKWKGFSKGELKIHYDKHVVKKQEFGNITQVEYLKMAKSFASENGKDFKEVIEGKFIIKYDPVTGRVLVGHGKNKEIRTFYINDGRDADPLQAAIDYARNKTQANICKKCQ